MSQITKIKRGRNGREWTGGKIRERGRVGRERERELAHFVLMLGEAN